MSTIITGAYTPFTCTNLNQTIQYSEGNTIIPITPIIVTMPANYSKTYTATFTISAPTQASNVIITSTTKNNIEFVRVNNVVTVSSEYLITGTKVNNQPWWGLAMKNLTISAANSDLGESFTIGISITDGTTTLTGNIIVNTIAVSDVIGNYQTFTAPMAMQWHNGLSTHGGTNIQVNDANEANKTYRVTVTAVNQTNSSGTSNGKLGPSWSSSKVFTGTQAAVNASLANLAFISYSTTFYGTYGYSYTQEVLTTTEPNVTVPYLQESGFITFNLPYTAPFAPNTSISYIEDTTLNFSAGTITTLENFEEPCGVDSEYSCYTATITALGTYTTENPIFLTFAGDVAVDNTVTITGDKTTVNAAIANLQLIPPADYASPISLSVTIKNGPLASQITLYDAITTVTCSSSHADATIINSMPFVLGSNTVNFGSITDQAVSKNYTVTVDAVNDSALYGSWSDPTGLGTWNATGGVNNFGRLTITGTKTQVNDSLDGLVYTTAGSAALNDVQQFVYTQTQTTNNLVQATKTIFVANSILFSAGNAVHEGVNAFTYDQDVTQTWDLASLGSGVNTTTSYTVKLVLGTPLTPVNLGSITGWTQETDYIWSKTGVKSALNAALAAVVFVPPAQLVSDFSLDIQLYDGATLIFDLSGTSGKTIHIDQLAATPITSSALTYDQDTASTWANLASFNSNFGSGTYTIRLVTSIANIGAFTGWTQIDGSTFEKTDTKANLITALNDVVFNPIVTFLSNFTITLSAYRSGLLLCTSAAKDISLGTVYAITPTNSLLSYNQDNNTTWAFATLSSNVGAAKTYTVTLTSSVENIGEFTGWTTASTTTFTKTDTGTNIIAALAALEFVPTSTLSSSFTLTAKLTRSGSDVHTSIAKAISIGSIYSITFNPASQTFDQDSTKTFTGVVLLNSTFNNSKTYTVTLTLTNISGTLIPSLDFGDFTGWTKTVNVLNCAYTKTDTGINLINACNNLEYTSPIANSGSFGMSVTAIRSGNVASSTVTDKLFILSTTYSISLPSTHIQFNSTSNILYSSVGLNSIFSDSRTYTIILSITSPVVSGLSITGAAWTVVSPTQLSFTGNKTSLTSALNNVTLISPLYLNTDINVSLVLYRNSIEISTYPSTTQIDNVPYARFISTSSGYSYLGFSKAMPLYLIPAPWQGWNRDLLNILQLNNIPNDGTTYSIVLETTASNIFGSISSSGVTWSAETPNRWVSSLASKTNLDLALTDIRFTPNSSIPTTLNPSNITVKLRGTSPFVETTINSFYYTTEVRNNAVIDMYRSTLYFYSSSGVFQIGAIPTIDINTLITHSFIDPLLTYTIQVNLGGTGTAVVGWTPIGNNTYTMTGNLNYLNDKLKNFSMTASATTNRYVSFDLYYGGAQLSTQGLQISTN